MRTSLFAPSWGEAFGSSSTPTLVKVSASSHLTLPSMTPRNIHLPSCPADLSASLEYLRNKHVWAATLAADQHQYLTAAAS
jgi:hypothetical protein